MEHDEDYLCHHGVKGMKWGRRKQRVSSGSSKRKSSVKKTLNNAKSNISKKIESIDKEKVKKVVKTTAYVTGKVATAALLGYVGTTLWNEVSALKVQNWADQHKFNQLYELSGVKDKIYGRR